MTRRIAHVAIATNSIAVTAEFYKTLGLELNSIETIRHQKVKVAVMNVGDSAIELVEPTAPDSPVSKFLRKRGDGLHHVSLEVDDLEKELALLRERNIKLIDEHPRVGAEGRLFAFIHPDSTGGVLIELSEPGPKND